MCVFKCHKHGLKLFDSFGLIEEYKSLIITNHKNIIAIMMLILRVMAIVSI